MSGKFSPKGHDGKTADLGFVPQLPASPVISKFPWLASAIAECETCLTKWALTGRPGTIHMIIPCHHCDKPITVNNGRGFVFWGLN